LGGRAITPQTANAIHGTYTANTFTPDFFKRSQG
jgi:hypothetical protein